MTTLGSAPSRDSRVGGRRRLAPTNVARAVPQARVWKVPVVVTAFVGAVATVVVVDGWFPLGDPRVAVEGTVGVVMSFVLLGCVVGLTVEAMRHRRISAALSRRKGMLELVQAVSLATSGNITDRSALHLALQAVCSKLGWSAGIVHLVDEHEDLSVSTSISEGTDPALIDLLATHDHRSATWTSCPVRRAMAARRPVCSEDDRTCSWVDGDRPVGVAVPIIAGGEVVGALEFVVDTPRPFRFSSELRDTLATVGVQLGHVVQRARDHQRLQAAKDAEEARRVAAERSNAAKSEFLATMTHELRTPLNAVVGFAQLLEEERLPSEQAAMVGYISRSGHHVLTLVNGLLDISRIEAGHLDLALTDVSVAEQTAEAVAMLALEADGQGIELHSAVPDDLHVRADAQRLFQVLLNLLSNAVKYNRPSGTVTVAATALSDNMVRVTIDDTGVGIPPEHLPRLFRPFDRLGASDVEGTGLGLAVSRHLVEAMGGRIGVSSDVGVGTRFWIDLPQTDPDFRPVRMQAMPSEYDMSDGPDRRPSR